MGDSIEVNETCCYSHHHSVYADVDDGNNTVVGGGDDYGRCYYGVVGDGDDDCLEYDDDDDGWDCWALVDDDDCSYYDTDDWRRPYFKEDWDFRKQVTRKAVRLRKGYHQLASLFKMSQQGLHA